MAGHAEGTELSPLMKPYAGEMRKLECRFHSLKLEHFPRGQDAAVKELSQIAAKGLPIPFGVAVEKLSQPSIIPEEEEPEVPPEQGTLPVAELQGIPPGLASERCTLPAQACRTN
jgi:hypothetical protein